MCVLALRAAERRSLQLAVPFVQRRRGLNDEWRTGHLHLCTRYVFASIFAFPALFTQYSQFFCNLWGVFDVLCRMIDCDSAPLREHSPRLKLPSMVVWPAVMQHMKAAEAPRCMGE